MGILDVFNKEKRDLWLAKADNEECVKERRTLLNSFRNNAISELSFKHPDALFLSNLLHAKFMVHSGSAGRIFLGQYADYHAPFLEFVPHDANLSQWLAVNANFRKQVARRDGVVRADTREKLKTLRGFYQEDFIEGFKRRGFAVTSSFETQWLFGGAVFLNGKQIAESTVWAPKPSGYFAEQIYKHIIRTRHRTSTGFSNLVLKMSKCHTNYGPSEYHYDMHFENGADFSDTVRPSASLKNIMDLRNFLSAVERDFTEPNVDGDEKMIFIPSDYSKLDSSEMPPHDPSIESDYPF